MEKTFAAQGQCLCGKVKIDAKKVDRNMGACHCGMCRKWSAGPFLSLDCGTEISFEGSEHITRFSSSEWAERGFCKECGTNLFYYLKGQKHYILSAGVIDTDEKIIFDHQVFIEEKPESYEFANSTKNMTGEELFALFS